MEISVADKAEILIEALPYIQKYHNKIIVVKYGGSAMTDVDLKKSVMCDLVLLAQIGIKVVLIHGGGPEINETLDKMNLKSEFIDGLRKTDKECVGVVQMVLAGKVNKDLVNLIQVYGGTAVGLSGIDGKMIMAKTLDPQLGYVGEVVKVNASIIEDVLEKGYIPVISTVGCDAEGNVYNVNADTAAAAIAAELKASALINMTDIKGVLAKKDDESTLISEIDVSRLAYYIESGIVTGGMIPKCKFCAAAVMAGVKRVFIIDGRVKHAILIEVLSDKGIGTMFYRS